MTYVVNFIWSKLFNKRNKKGSCGINGNQVPNIMFQSVEPHRLDKLIEFYKEQIGKQIFISFDDLARVSDETKQVLFDDHYKVIYLQENAKALFGREWNTEE
jgi:3-methyladenine DNA glycosylase/8-oxoguanine DNA glycosylase